MIIVTGATGHVGNVLVKRLVKEGNEVGIVVHNKAPEQILGDIKVKVFKADVTDYNSLLEPFSQADIVYHMAAKISITTGEFEELKKINVEGVKNVLRACKECKVKRLVYASSVHALVEPPHGTPLVEKVADTTDKVFGDYAKSKVLAYKEVMKAVKDGLDVVICFPSGVIGPYDYKPSQIGQIIKNFLSGKPNKYFDGQYDYVDVRDVVNGIILAAKLGKTGQGYILSGNKITIKEIYNILLDYTKMDVELTKIPSWLVYLSSMFSEFFSKLKHEEPLFTPYSVLVLRSNALISNQKAKQELGYTTRPIKETFKDAVDWFRGESVSIS